ncbi:MAG: carboxypeptidase-like regulatory domain-containing protein [Bacteroidota bacterium]
MTRTHNFDGKFFGMVFIMFLGFMTSTYAQQGFVEYKGKVLDTQNREPLVFVNLNLKDTNISTVTNTEGEFVLKVSEEIKNSVVIFSLLGYEQKEVALVNLGDGKVFLDQKVTQLSEVNLTAFNNPESLVRKVFQEKAKNNASESVLMTAFYRETIKRRNRNVSLTEAVVNLYKQPYTSPTKDMITLHKARKSTDYKRLDTVAVKLQGGPFSTLYLDIMKYPEYIFTNETIEFYNFSFDAPSAVNDRPVYVVKFEQKPSVVGSGYRGKLFIDAESLALTSATYALNIKNSKEASELFVRKKPRDINVYPTQAAYRVDYRQKNGKWYYGYGSVQLTFKVNKRRKLFNSVYTLSSEMAVTDWEFNTTGFSGKPKDRLKPTIIIADAVSGFSDPDFWGPYNVIEPEKSIESAINKIKRKIRREKG